MNKWNLKKLNYNISLQTEDDSNPHADVVGMEVTDQSKLFRL